MNERFFEKDNKVYAISDNLKTAFNCLKRGKQIIILKRQGIMWKEKKLINEMFLNQGVRMAIKCFANALEIKFTRQIPTREEWMTRVH